MAENLSLMLVAWLFMLLLGGCVLINAIVDLTAAELRRWLAARFASSKRHEQLQVARSRVETGPAGGK